MNPGWLPEKTWRLMLASMPIPCVDVIFVRTMLGSDAEETPYDEVLYGWRKIPPYRDVWALPGGRVFKGESPERAARRTAERLGLEFDRLVLNGVFNANFPTRSDISTSFVALGARGEPKVDGNEFRRFMWSKGIPRPVGGMYRKMIEAWKS